MFKLSSPIGDPQTASTMTSGTPEAVTAALNEAASRLARLGACARSAEIEIGLHPAISGDIVPGLERICTEASELVTLLARAQAALAEADAPNPAPAPAPAPTVPAGAPERFGCGPYSFAARSRANGNGLSPAAIRLFATQLAETGLSRGEIEARLCNEAGISDPSAYVPDLLAKVAT